MAPFGQPAAGGTGMSSVFGQPAQNQQNNAATNAGGGLFSSFGSPKPAATNTASPFGQATAAPALGNPFIPSTAPTTRGNPFATAAPATLSNTWLKSVATTTGGSVLGQNNQNQTGLGGQSLLGGQGQSMGIFNLPQQSTTNANGGLGMFSQQQKSSVFGAPQQQQQQQTQQIQQNAPTLGRSTLGQSQAQPAGAYFDSLLAKAQKNGEGAKDIQDLPSLELGIGDVRHRLRQLQSKPTEKPLDSKAHYLLAGAGIDPSAAAKDLGMLDVQSGRADRATHGYAPTEIDVETYLSNLQTKTTLSMIADGLERSVRDFDNFLEDHVNMEWEAQRKRIYNHFGIKPREDSAANRESQAAFGRSKRNKSQANVPRGSGRNSMFGRSAQRSVIGSSSRIGSHRPDFADVDGVGDESSALKNQSSLEDRIVRERSAKLAEKVRNLNAARLAYHPYPLLTELAEVEAKSNEPHAPHVVEAYRAMIEIVEEHPEAQTTINGATAKPRGFARRYLDENVNSPQAVEMRKRILSGANAFLEKQFVREVESLITKHPHEAKLGGLPDIISKIKAYIRLRSARKDLVPDNTELQQVQGEPVWAIVFYLLRSGHVNDAAKYVNDNNHHFRGIDRTFSTYLNNYAASEDKRITNRKLLDRCTNEYIQRSRNAPENSIDPFRMACYKVIGRIELSNRNLEGLNSDINDWIWLQFNLARESDKALEMAGESYGLAELQSSIREIGQKHFPKSKSDDANNGSFGMFFYLQILSGLFEDAIAYLYSFSYVDAVHFGLALTYYGLLRPSDPLTGSGDLRSYSTKNLPQINFGPMIGHYTRDFRAADVVSAVDYLALICLNQDLSGEAGIRQAALCHEALRELVLETREFSKLLGDIRPNGELIKGVIEERRQLIGLDTEQDFVNTVTLQAASFADENGRTTDSVLLYHLAGEYDEVVAIVSRALSEAISLDIGEDPMRLMPVKPRTSINGTDPSNGSNGQQQQPKTLSLAAIDDPVELARTMMTMYERDAMFSQQIQDQNRIACRVLLEMSSIKALVEAGQWAKCLDDIRLLEILPLEANGNASTIRSYASKFASLPQPVSINVPNLLMWTIIACVRQREQLLSSQFSGNEGTRKLMVDQLRQITLDLTTYTSQLRYRFPAHLHEALARATAE